MRVPEEVAANADTELVQGHAAGPEWEAGSTQPPEVAAATEVPAATTHDAILFADAVDATVAPPRAGATASAAVAAVPGHGSNGAAARATAPPSKPAKPVPASASALVTDPNAVNGLMFFALDSSRSLLYVSEQSNHRVRCVALAGPGLSAT